MQDLKVTIIQADLFWEDKKKNLSNFQNKIEKLESDLDLIVLPEMFNTAFSMKPELFSEKPLGETHLWMAEMSIKKQASIAGSYMVNVDGQYFNRFVVIHPDGKYQTYDKYHLFRMSKEDHHFTAGNKDLIFEIKGWKIKAMICYDLRFPVFSKNNYKNDSYDYDALIYVASWPKERNHIWSALLLARAIENQAYVIGVNRVGKDGLGFEYIGSSCIINPKGDYIIENKIFTEFESSANLNYKNLIDFRNKFKVGLDWDSFEIIKP